MLRAGSPAVVRTVSLWLALPLLTGVAGAQCWEEVQAVTASDADSGDFFGSGVALSGGRAAVGATSDDDAILNGGAAYVLEQDPGGTGLWSEVAKILPPDPVSSSERFGNAVGLDGDTLVVGSPWHQHPGAGTIGSAYVFERDAGGSGAWGLVVEHWKASGGSDHFGAAVAIDGDWMVVGAPSAKSLTCVGCCFSGLAYVYGRDVGGPENWGLVRALQASDCSASDSFGNAVAIDGDTVVVGAWRDDTIGEATGSAYVFDRNLGGPDQWGERLKLVAPDGGDNNFFGFAVDIAGDTVVVGDYGLEVATGAAYVFDRNGGGADVWGQVARLYEGFYGDSAGHSVAIAGDQILVGAPGHDGEFKDTGRCFVYARDLGGASSWGLLQVLEASAPAEFDQFGREAVGEPDTFLVTAPFASPLLTLDDMGAVYAFEERSAQNYCTAGTTASGCQATLSVSGPPSASAASGFTVDATTVEGGNVPGIMYYATNGRQAHSWGGGSAGCSSFQCVVPPVQRGSLVFGSGTAGTCEGFFTHDLASQWTAKPGQNPGAGATVQAQYWFRDPASACTSFGPAQTTSLSDAVEFVLCP